MNFQKYLFKKKKIHLSRFPLPKSPYSAELTRIARLKGINPGAHEFIVPVKHVPFHQFIQLLANAGLVVGNSSSGVREAGAFGTPVVNLGTRQIGRESASNVLHVQNPASADQVSDALRKHFRKEFPRSFIYGDGRAVPRIIRYLKRVNLDAVIQKTFDFSGEARERETLIGVSRAMDRR